MVLHPGAVFEHSLPERDTAVLYLYEGKAAVGEQGTQLRVALADSLANSGRGREAARVYLKAAPVARARGAAW